MEVAKILSEEAAPQEDLIEYFDKCIMQNKQFKKVYNIKNIPVTMRTRKSKEVTQIFKKMKDSGESNIDSLRLLNDCNLAFSLSSFGSENMDKGSLEERLAVIEEMDSTKKAILWDIMAHFNAYVENMRVQHLNFLKA